MSLADDFGSGQVFLSMIWFFLFIIWIWLLITVFADIFRSRDLSGWSKALWTLLILVLPYLGVLVYLIARGRTMHARAEEDAKAQDAKFRKYVQSVSGDGSAPAAADEIARLADLHAKGVLSDAEFAQAKAKVLT